MTSVVSISAHCGDAKEVHVVVTDAGSLVEDFHIANGEKAERYAYDNRVISVTEVVKIDRRAKEIKDAEFSLRQATLRYEDAASRGFPLHNEALLKADVAARQAELDALTAPAVNLAPAPEPMGGVHFTAHALVADPGPSEQAAESGALPAESKAFLDSLDPAPMISDGTTDSVEGPTES